MALNRVDIEHLARLARLALEPQDVDFYALHLNRILEHVAVITSLDTDGVEPMTTPTSERRQDRADAVVPGLATDAALGNAPLHNRGMFEVGSIQEVE